MIRYSARLQLIAYACAAGSILIAAPAAAQEESSGSRWLVTVGGGAQVFPKYPGGDSYGINPWPIVGLRREGDPLPFDGADDGFDIGLLGRQSRFNIGPVINFQTKREEDDVGLDVGDVDFTIEAGGFVELYPIENLRLRANLRKGIGGHDGMIGDAGADLILRDDDTHIFAIGPRVRWANRTYHRAYFGVTPGVATATGLAPFEPGSGIYAVGAVAGYTQMLGRSWGLEAYAGYDRLMGDAADSPIVRATGSRGQLSGGIGLFYTFAVGR
jgi:outer membrane protein